MGTLNLRPVFFDIDGTLTDTPQKTWGRAKQDRIDKVKELNANGTPVVIWSGGGTKYAQDFCAKYEIEPLAAIGKPEKVVDDNPNIRPKDKMPIKEPEQFFGG